MLYFLEHKKDCTGCGACMTVCPVQCIAMEEDEEGFLYPVSDQSCISCRKCEAACRRRMASDGSRRNQRAYAAVSRDREIWRRSSSGGVFRKSVKPLLWKVKLQQQEQPGMNFVYIMSLWKA